MYEMSEIATLKRKLSELIPISKTQFQEVHDKMTPISRKRTRKDRPIPAAHPVTTVDSPYLDYSVSRTFVKSSNIFGPVATS